MNRVFAIHVFIGLLTVFLLSTPAFSELGAPELYDDFNAKKIGDCKKCLDPRLWDISEVGPYVGETVREIKAKRAVLAVRGWGNMTEDLGASPARNRLNLVDQTENIVGACFTPRVKKWELNDCAANVPSDANDGYSRARMRYSYRLYDTNTMEENDDGVVFGGIQLWRSTEHDENGMNKKNFRIAGWVSQCNDPTCTTFDVPIEVDFGEFNKNNKTPICIAYDPDAREITLSAGSDVMTFGEDTGLPVRDNWGSPNRIYQAVEARVDVENCPDDKKTAYIEGDVDNIEVFRYIADP